MRHVTCIRLICIDAACDVYQANVKSDVDWMIIDARGVRVGVMGWRVVGGSM